MDIRTTLDQAIAAAKQGRNRKARYLLEQVLDAEERNERAWLWLSSVLDDVEERTICLENVLTINPNNEIARKGLESLQAAPPTQEAAQRDAPISEAGQPTIPLSASPNSLDIEDEWLNHATSPDRRIFIAITVALVLILVCTVVSILSFVLLSPLG